MALEYIKDLIKAFREDERDTVGPDYFWTDAQLVRFANQALVAFAEKTMSILDGDVELAYSAGQDEIPYPAYIIDIIEATCGRNGFPQRLDVNHSGGCSSWGYGRQQPSLFVNEASGVARLRPIPVTDGTVVLQVVRRPLREVGRDDRTPDVPATDRHVLLLHMKHCAYRVNDAEIFDPAKAINFAAEFNQECQLSREKALLRRGDCSRPIRSRW